MNRRQRRLEIAEKHNQALVPQHPLSLMRNMKDLDDALNNAALLSGQKMIVAEFYDNSEELGSQED